MSHSVRLPNGFLMTNVPDEATQDEIARHAIDKGYATPDDFTAYPDVYSAVAPKGESAVSSTESTLGGTPEMMANLNSYAQSTPVKVQHAVRDMAAGLALMPEAGASRAALLAAETGTQAATSTAQQLEHNIETGESGGYGKAAVEGALTVPAGMAVGKVASKVAKPIFEKISPITSQYLKGFFTGAERAEDVTPTPKFKDEIPEPQPREVDPEAPIDRKAQAAEQDRLAAIGAEQQQWLDEFHKLAAHRMASLEAESYIQPVLAKTETTSQGEGVANAMSFYRGFVQDYETGILPHPGDTRPELSGLAQYEAIMRDDSPKIDELLNRYEAGESVHPQELYDAIEAYKMGTVQAVEDWFKSKPEAFLNDLIDAEKAAPGVNSWLDSQGALGAGKRRFVADKLYRAHLAGTVDAISGMTDKFLNDIRQERALTSDEFLYATENGIRNMATALKHKLATLDKMENNVRAAIATSKGEKLSSGAKGWQNLTDDEQAIYWGMVHTHEAAERGADVMRQYRRFESLNNALPGRRAVNPFDQVNNAATAATVGFMTGGPLGAMIAPIARAGAEKAVNTVRRKVIKSAVTKAIEQAAKE